VQDADLVLDLGAAEHGHERPLRLLEQRTELFQFPFEQEAGVRGHKLRHAYGGSVGPVSRAERVVDEQVPVRGELTRELGVVLRLARVEARVLEQAHAFVRQELAQALPHRLEREP
jgi:hypothetical protein